MHRRIILACLSVAATIAFMAASGGTAMAATTTPTTIGWGNVLVTEGAHPVVIARVGPFQLTAQCTSSGQGKYFLKSSVTAHVYGEDGSYDVTMAPRKAYPITSDVDSDEAFLAYAPKTGTSINGTPFNWPATDLGGTQCEFQGEVTQTS